MAEYDLVVVDGPNLYNRIAESLPEPAPGLDDDRVTYLASWFDIDRLLAAALSASSWPPPHGVALVHSDHPLGRTPLRLDQKQTAAFWSRQARLPGCRDVPVRFLREELEEFETKCEQCGHHQRHIAVRGEKGVDAAAIATLYEKMHHWRSAVLAANDVDYAPVLDSLHRMGRVVSVLGRRTTDGSALERRGHEFHEIPEGWLLMDLAAFRCFRADGALDRLLVLLRKRGFKCGCRSVPDIERERVGTRHDFELMVSHEEGERDGVLDLVVQALSFPRLFTQKRNPELTVFVFDGGRPIFGGVHRRADDGAAWRAETTHVFPDGLLERHG